MPGGVLSRRDIQIAKVGAARKIAQEKRAAQKPRPAAGKRK